MECERLRHVDQVPEPLAESTDDRMNGIGMRAIYSLEVASREECQTRRLGSDGRSRIRAAVEEWKFGNRPPWALDMEDLRLSLGACTIDAYLSRLNDVKTTACFTRREEYVPGGGISRNAVIGKSPHGRLHRALRRSAVGGEG